MAVSRKILVVDDEDGLRVSIGKFLELHGFEVVLAPNAEEALKAIDAQRFDVLLSDLRMPSDGDGITVVLAMRKRHPEAITLLMSATVDQSAAKIPVAVDSILHKPFQMRDVVGLIRSKLAEAPAH